MSLPVPFLRISAAVVDGETPRTRLEVIRGLQGDRTEAEKVTRLHFEVSRGRPRGIEGRLLALEGRPLSRRQPEQNLVRGICGIRSLFYGPFV